MDPIIYVINRRVDQTRLSAFRAGAETLGLTFERIAALDGHSETAPFFLYKDYLGDHFWGETDIKPGAFACYLSHMAAWRCLLASEADMALICEDDAVLISDPASLFNQAAELADFDVIFCNERLAAWRAAAGLGAGFQALGDVIDGLKAAGLRPDGEALKAPGADCYLISRTGAQKLLANAAEDRVIAGVDWMVARRAAELPADWPETAMLGDAETVNVTAFVADPVAAQTVKRRSAIGHSVTVPIAALKDAAPLGEDIKVPEGDVMDPVFAAFAARDYYEAPALELMRRWMPEGGVYVDVGAHVGGHMLFMLRHGGAGRAIPFEYNPKALAHLNELVEQNGLDERVDRNHLGYGLTEDRGKREAVGSAKNLSNGRLREGFVEKIKTRPGDAALRESAVDMIKLDVNGDEREALKGLRKTLKRKRPVIAIDLTRPRAQKALPLLSRLGYVQREEARWADCEGDRRFAIFTSIPPVVPQDEGAAGN